MCCLLRFPVFLEFGLDNDWIWIAVCCLMFLGLLVVFGICLAGVFALISVFGVG